MVGPRFVLLTLSLFFLGSYARLFRNVRALPFAARAAVYFATGLFTVVMEMFVLSMCNIHWNAWLLTPLPIALGILAFTRKLPPATDNRQPTTILILPLAAIAILTSAVLAAQSTSGDFVYFWGTKGQKWGAEHFLDTAFTKEPSHYMHPDYPPLVPLYYAWTMLGGDVAMDWWGAILATPLFLAVAAAAMWGFGRYAQMEITDGIVALFTTLYALFYMRNQVAGNAEPPLHMFECIALAALTCWRTRSSEHDAVAAIALSGVALTKVEGGVFVLLVCGLTWIARQGTLRERFIEGAKMAALPIATLAAWLLFGLARGLTDTYVPREDLSIRYVIPTAIELLKELSLHLWYTPWIALLILLVRGRVRNAIPYLAACAIFLFFLLSVYTRAEPHLEWSAGRTLMTPLMLAFFAVMAAHRRAALEPYS